MINFFDHMKNKNKDDNSRPLKLHITNEMREKLHRLEQEQEVEKILEEVLGDEETTTPILTNDIDKYNGTATKEFESNREELLLDYCRLIQKLIYEHNSLFDKFPNDLIHVIDVATNHLLMHK